MAIVLVVATTQQLQTGNSAMDNRSLAERAKSKLVAFMVLLGAALLIFGAGYLARDIPARKTIAEAESGQRAAEDSVVAMRAENALLSANVWIYRAAAALDDRNFGNANDSVNEATKQLNSVQLPKNHPSVARLGKTRDAADKIDISVATNLEPQRESLLALARDVTRLTQSVRTGRQAR